MLDETLMMLTHGRQDNLVLQAMRDQDGLANLRQQIVIVERSVKSPS